MSLDITVVMPTEPRRDRQFHLEGSHVYTAFLGGGTARSPKKYLREHWRLGTLSEALRLKIPACVLCARQRDITRERRKRGG